jgi:deoxyribose-phosphate aldolase
VTVRPSDIDLAARWTGSSLALGSIIDWPHGYSTTATKQYAARDALRRGAKEITVTMNTGKLISRQFQYLEMELDQIAEACHEVGALLTVNLESRFLTEEHKVVACRVVRRAGADFLATTEPSDIPLLLQHTRDRIQVKLRDAATLEAALEAFAAGCSRIEASSAAEILDAWKARITPEVSEQHA